MAPNPTDSSFHGSGPPNRIHDKLGGAGTVEPTTQQGGSLWGGIHKAWGKYIYFFFLPSDILPKLPIGPTQLEAEDRGATGAAHRADRGWPAKTSGSPSMDAPGHLTASPVFPAHIPPSVSERLLHRNEPYIPILSHSTIPSFSDVKERGERRGVSHFQLKSLRTLSTLPPSLQLH